VQIIDVARLYDAITIIQNVISKVSGWPGAQQSAQMTAANRLTVVDMLAKFSLAIDLLGVPVTKLSVRDTVKNIEKTAVALPFIGCAQMLLNISQTLQRELEVVSLFTLSASMRDFYFPGVKCT
jgi:hypothetical protein